MADNDRHLSEVRDLARGLNDNVTELHREPRANLEPTEDELRYLIEVIPEIDMQDRPEANSILNKMMHALAIESGPGGELPGRHGGMSELQDILVGTIEELERREGELIEEVERIQQSVKAELKDVRKALASLRKQVEAVSRNGAEADPAPSNVDDDTKEAVLRQLETRRKDKVGARPSGIAKETNLSESAIRVALRELEASGDVEVRGKGVWYVVP